MGVVLEEKKKTVIKGLTDEQVNNRIQKKETNEEVKAPSKSVLEIITSNVFTYFNFVFTFIAVILIMVKSYRDLTFLPIIIANTLIGIVQELRSKKVLDKLKMMNSPYATVIRNGEKKKILSKELVKDDIVIFKAGDQICADATVVEGEVAVNEALLTGESDEINKKIDDKLMSGSFIVSGECYAKLTKVGAESYISQLTLEAKKVKKGEQSEMIRSLNRLVRIAGIIIIPIGASLFWQQYYINGTPLKESVQSMVAAVLGMIPEGLFLLASVTLAVSAMKLAKNKVLIHDMKSIETLARVNVLCVDKTGTITENRMVVSDVIGLDTYKGNTNGLNKLIGDFVKAQKSDNITMKALKKYFKDSNNSQALNVSGFSSQYKYSGVQFENESYVIGAPEFILGEQFDKYKDKIETYSLKGERVLAFCKYDGIINGKELDGTVTPYALVTMENPIREKAVQTFKYFREQGVEIKVISGDNPLTVSEVAKKAEIENADKYIDVSKLKYESEIIEAVKKYTVFGRVTPQQKRIIIKALKNQGKTVAMTGDGVNDVLALKDADCSVAMASGSQAAIQSAQLVLLESDFSKMPGVVEEGRRTVNNLECAGSLFLVKNLFSFYISILAICFSIRYPLKPSQVSLISMFTIGLPAFLLSQAPNTSLIKGRFISNIVGRALPGGLTDTLMIVIMVIFGRIFKASSEDIATASTILLAIVGVLIVYNVSKPMTSYKWIIILVCILGLIICMSFLKRLFALNDMSIQGVLLCANFSIMTEAFLRYVTKLTSLLVSLQEKIYRKLFKKKYNII